MSVFRSFLTCGWYRGLVYLAAVHYRPLVGLGAHSSCRLLPFGSLYVSLMTTRNHVGSTKPAAGPGPAVAATAGAAAAVVRVASPKMVHMKCRNNNYTRTDIPRLEVPDDKLSWSVEWPAYNPPVHTASSVIGKPWADPEKVPNNCWNQLDRELKVDRKSFHGEYAFDEHGPKNPMGRTGMRGRGCLGRWGPNHAADPIVTRWKRFEKKIVVDPEFKKPVLQFVAIQRHDTKEWAIPGGMVDPGEMVTVTLKREFGEEALNSLEADPSKKKKLQQELDKFFQEGQTIYKGYVDDPRNTDNAWMETVAVNFHDEKGTTVSRFKLQSGDDAVGVKWMDIDSDLKLYASHVDMIKKVVDFHNAYWSKSK